MTDVESKPSSAGHFVSFEVFILMMVLLTIVLWECFRSYCRRPKVEPLHAALLDAQTQTSHSGGTPMSLRRVIEADIYFATSRSSDKFHTNPMCRGLNNADREKVEHRVLCQFCNTDAQRRR
mgnify:FL=1